MVKQSGVWLSVDHRWFRVLALGWMTLIFYLSSQEHLPIPGVFEFQDKCLHFGAYTVLALFVAAGWRQYGVPFTAMNMLTAALLVSGYGVTDEFHQSFVPGREVSVWDWTADTLGGIVGAWLVYRWRRLSGS